jgi:glucosylceramidase
MNKYFLTIIFLLSLFIFIGCSQKKGIEWISSTDKQRWRIEESLSFSEVTGTTNVITIVESQPMQVIDGFGGCFNELGWDALSLLDTAMTDSLVSLFFGPASDLKFTLGRVPIGANDYARDWYSLDDTPGDFSMQNFNIVRDKKSIIPYILKALSHEQKLKVWGSPWCPPAWMKTNNHYACKMGEVNDLCCPDKEGKEGVTQFIMQTRYLDAYALYFSKFIRAYRDAGVPVYAVHVQNEPNSCQNFPSCIWKASDLGIFIGQYLGPRLLKDVPDAEIWYGTIERPYIENIDTVLRDPDAKKYVKGLGFQWAGKDAIGRAHGKFPAVSLMETESECGDGSNDWKAAEYTFSLIRHYFENGANAYMYWNMVLDETGKSQWGWKQNSLITIDRKTLNITLNPEYYLFKHVSHFVEPGARWLNTQGNRQDVIAFVNPDGRVNVLVLNQSEREDEVVISTPRGNFKVSLKPRSFNTFVYSQNKK